jgi:hypothetical protein
MDYKTWRIMTSSKKTEPKTILPCEPYPPPKNDEEHVILLKKRIIQLEKEIKTLKNKKIIDKIDDFVDNWFEENKDDVDIGNIKVGPFQVDLLPDEMEKHIYKKSLKIFVTMLGDMTK